MNNNDTGDNNNYISEIKTTLFPSYLPVLVTMISGVFAFYSGMTSKIYYLGYYEVFSISSAFVKSNTGFPNRTLIQVHLDLIIFILCLIILIYKADQVIDQYYTIKRIINTNTPRRLKGVLFGRVIKSICENCCITVLIVLTLLAIDYFYIFKFSWMFGIVRIIESFVSIVLIVLLFILIHFLLVEIKIKNTTHKNGHSQEEDKQIQKKATSCGICNSIEPLDVIKNQENIDNKGSYFIINPRELNFYKQSKGVNIVIVEALVILFLEIGFLLIGSYFTGRGDALYNKEYCMTMDDEFIAIPVSDNRYAMLKAEEKDNELFVLTDTVLFLENNIPVHFKKFRHTYIYDHEQVQIIDPVCEYLYYASFEP